MPAVASAPSKNRGITTGPRHSRRAVRHSTAAKQIEEPAYDPLSRTAATLRDERLAEAVDQILALYRDDKRPMTAYRIAQILLMPALRKPSNLTRGRFKLAVLSIVRKELSEIERKNLWRWHRRLTQSTDHSLWSWEEYQRAIQLWNAGIDLAEIASRLCREFHPTDKPGEATRNAGQVYYRINRGWYFDD